MLFTVKITGRKKKTIQTAAELLEIDVGTLDADYGLVAIDPDEGLYAVRTREDAGLERKGGYADPLIEPMGPTRKTRRTT